MFHLKKKALILSTSFIIIACAIIGGVYGINRVQSADFTFLQIDWSGGQTGNIANHTDNKTGWSQYSAKDADVVANSEIKFTDTAATITKTSDIDFSSGIFSNTVSAGTGASAYVSLGATTLDQIETMAAVMPQAEYASACAENSATHKIYCFGGAVNNQIIQYDPATDTRTTMTAVLPQNDFLLACAENSATNKIYCFGGHNNFNRILQYDPVTDALTIKAATLPENMEGLGCAENSDTHKIYCFGGSTSSNKIIQYDPATDTRTTMTATLPRSETSLSCAENSATHKIYCFGGFQSSGARLNEIIQYDPATDTRTTMTATLPQGVFTTCAEKSDTHKIYCFGGNDGWAPYFNQIVQYDPSTDTRTTMAATLASADGYLACAENSGAHQIYCFGGVYSGNKIIRYPKAGNYPSSGTFTSPIADAGTSKIFTTLNYNTTLNGQTITIDARAGNTAVPDGTWTAWQTNISNNGIISALSGNRYAQYRVNFSTSNNTITPTFNDITFNYYTNYPSSQTLTSNIYNTQTVEASFSRLQWTENLPTNTDIKFQLRTSSDGSSWSSWCGPDDGVDGTCNNATYFTDNSGNEAIDDTQRDKSNDQYAQYKVFLVSTDGQNTPTLSDISLSYATISIPVIATQAATNIMQTQATLNASISNTGNNNPERLIEYGTTSGNYPNSCTANTGGIGAYSCQITSLTPDTTYYYRAKATNSAGTSYGTEQSFQTLPTQVTITDPDPGKMDTVVSSGQVTLNSGSITATPLVTTNTNLNIQDGVVSLSIPQNTQITNTDSGNFNFQNFIAENAITTVKQTIPNSLSAVKVGVPNTRLSFSQPITLTIDVSPAYNGRTLDVLYQNDNESTWHSQTSCTITDGKCIFQTNHATTYTVNGSGNMVGELGINLNTDIQEVIALDCGTSIVNMGNLTPGTPVTGSSTCLTTTNANGGYNLSVQRDDSTDTTMDKTTEAITNITDKTPWNPTAPNAQTWSGTGLGFTVYDSSANKNTTWWGTGSTVNDASNLYAGFSPTQTDIMRHTTYSNLGTTTSIGYKLDVPPAQKSGAYSGAITYQVTTTP